METRMLTADEVAKRLNVSETWVYRKAQCGLMPHVRIGKLIRFIESDLEAWINGKTCKGCLLDGDRNRHAIKLQMQGGKRHGREEPSFGGMGKKSS